MTKPPPVILPHALRAEQGNPEITAFCPTCRERVVPLGDGTCGWCKTILNISDLASTTDPPPTMPTKPATTGGPHADLTARRERVAGWLTDHGPGICSEIAEQLDITPHLVRNDVAWLCHAGRVVETGRRRRSPNGGHPSYEYAITGTVPDPLELDPPALPATGSRELAVRYLEALIAHVEYAATTGGPTPGAHIYDRIERLLRL